MRVALLIDSGAHRGCSCATTDDLDTHEGYNGMELTSSGMDAEWNLQSYAQTIRTAVSRVLVSLGASDSASLRWGFQFFDWRSRGGCTPDELPRYLRTGMPFGQSSERESLVDGLKSRRLAPLPSVDPVIAALRVVHATLSERLYDSPTLLQHGITEAKRRSGPDTLRASLADLVVNYSWSSLALGASDSCALVVIASESCMDVDSEDGVMSSELLSGFEKLKPHIVKNSLQLVWVSLEETVSHSPILTQLGFKFVSISSVLAPTSLQDSFLTKIQRAVFDIHPPAASEPSAVVSRRLMFQFDVEEAVIWPPSPVRLSVGRRYASVNCRCFCGWRSGGTCCLSPFLRRDHVPITVHSFISVTDICPEWISGRHHVWESSDACQPLFQVPESFTDRDWTNTVWIVSLSLSNEAGDADASQVAGVLVVQSTQQVLFREMTCNLDQLLALRSADADGCSTDMTELAQAVLAAKLSSRVSASALLHTLHPQDVVTRINALTVADQHAAETPQPHEPAWSTESFRAWLFQKHKEADIPTGKWSPSELWSTSSDDDRSDCSSSDSDEHECASLGRDGGDEDNETEPPLPALDIFQHLPYPVCRHLLRLHSAYEEILHLKLKSPAFLVTHVLPDVLAEVSSFPVKSKPSRRRHRSNSNAKRWAKEYDLTVFLQGYKAKSDVCVWLPPNAAPCELPQPSAPNVVGSHCAAGIVRDYIREHLLVNKTELQQAYAPSIIAPSSIRAQNPNPFRPPASAPVIVAATVEDGNASDDPFDLPLPKPVPAVRPPESSKPPQLASLQLHADDGSDADFVSLPAPPPLPKRPSYPVEAAGPVHVEGWGGTSFDDDGVSSMILTESASPQKPAAFRDNRAEVMRRLGIGTKLRFNGSGHNNKAIPAAVHSPSTVHKPSHIRRLVCGRLERVTETVLQVILQLLLAAMKTGEASGKRKSSTDPCSRAIIDDIHGELSMAAFGIDHTMTVDLAGVFGPLPPGESVFTVERIVLTSLIPLFCERLPRTMLKIVDEFEFRELPPQLAAYRPTPRPEPQQPPSLLSASHNKPVPPAPAVAVVKPPTPTLKPAIDPAKLGKHSSLLAQPDLLFNEVQTRISSKIHGKEKVAKLRKDAVKRGKSTPDRGKVKGVQSPKGRRISAQVVSVQATPLRKAKPSLRVLATPLPAAKPLQFTQPSTVDARDALEPLTIAPIVQTFPPPLPTPLSTPKHKDDFDLCDDAETVAATWVGRAAQVINSQSPPPVMPPKRPVVVPAPAPTPAPAPSGKNPWAMRPKLAVASSATVPLVSPNTAEPEPESTGLRRRPVVP